MRFEDHAPEVEEVQVAPEAPAVSAIDLEPIALDIAAAVETAGPEETGAVLSQVQSGSAYPEALPAWIDDLRDPEQRESDVDKCKEGAGCISFVMQNARGDFIPAPAPKK